MVEPTYNGAAALRTAEGSDVPKAVRDLLTKARTAWLKNTEVLDLLTNYGRYNFSLNKDTPSRPSGAPQPPCVDNSTGLAGPAPEPRRSQLPLYFGSLHLRGGAIRPRHRAQRMPSAARHVSTAPA